MTVGTGNDGQEKLRNKIPNKKYGISSLSIFTNTYPQQYVNLKKTNKKSLNLQPFSLDLRYNTVF